MAKVFIEESTLTTIGDAIRSKTGKTELIDPLNMGTEISGIETGGGGGDLPEEALTITGNCSYRFANDGWNWFIENYGNRVTTKDITKCSNMFDYSQASTIPFQINVTDCENFNYLLRNCYFLSTAPKIRGTIKWGTSTDLSNIVIYCRNLRSLENLFTPEMLDGFSAVKVTSQYSTPQCNSIFYQLNSIRSTPSWWYKFKLNPESTSYPSATYAIYNCLGQNCYALDELINIPVWSCTAAQTSNMFGSMCSGAYRLKAMTFETNEDGTAIATKWKSQTITLSGPVGYANSSSMILNYNSGITADKQVKDDATYQALKNDPDWFTMEPAYSRYNHDSAVETLNSLPDTSAYLATAGGTNTIKFTGAAGSKTDGGAINTLTEAEIAVAAAKGWTVTLS